MVNVRKRWRDARSISSISAGTRGGGFSIREEAIPDFQRMFEEVVEELAACPPVLRLPADARSLSASAPSISSRSSRAGAVGAGNPEPLFLIRGFEVLRGTRVVGDGHLRLQVRDRKGRRRRSSGFSLAGAWKPAEIAGCAVDVLINVRRTVPGQGRAAAPDRDDPVRETVSRRRASLIGSVSRVHAMRVVVQRVSEASVEVDGARSPRSARPSPFGRVQKRGFRRRRRLDGAEMPRAQNLHDEGGKMNRSVLETGGEVLVVLVYPLWRLPQRRRRISSRAHPAARRTICTGDSRSSASVLPEGLEGVFGARCACGSSTTVRSPSSWIGRGKRVRGRGRDEPVSEAGAAAQSRSRLGVRARREILERLGFEFECSSRESTRTGSPFRTRGSRCSSRGASWRMRLGAARRDHHSGGHDRRMRRGEARKPSDENDAAAMLRLLSARPHE